jgi:tetratricopeptide (TPR) repeat protein
VSVSGIDLSKDRRELLVSYENDQIYTFPIFPRGGPTLEDFNSGDADEDNKPISELAAYGGHLNRYTFLKSAKYAGPNDEYICTGSDSGHAWIYERSTGAVAALLSADHSTCNGVVPHPSLPLFITYGIDSTAKLWRATTPVDETTDDSPLGRYQNAITAPYYKSTLVRHYKSVQKKLRLITEAPILPDQIPSRDDEYDESVFGGLLLRTSRRDESGGPYIANDLNYLPSVLQQNYFACVRATVNGGDEPVTSGLHGLMRRIALIRLRYQAAKMGLKVTGSVPWVMEGGVEWDKAELVPDFPCDWVPYDCEMTELPYESGIGFDTETYHAFWADVYGDNHAVAAQTDHDEDMDNVEEQSSLKEQTMEDDTQTIDQPTEVSQEDSSDHMSNSSQSHASPTATYLHHQNAWSILLKTILLLKESGNDALQSNNIHLAATRYDKAIRYCSLAFLQYKPGNLDFISNHQIEMHQNAEHETNWTPLLKAFITIRLNLSMTLLKPQIADRKGAIEQATLSLDQLKPFTAAKGSVLTSTNLSSSRPEPEKTYDDAKELQAKSYFRLGTAQNTGGDFSAAMHSFEKCAQCMRDFGREPEPVVARRLADAKRCAKRKKRNRRNC